MVTFDPADFIDLPGGCKKFTIRKDPTTACYWTLSNYVPEAFQGYRVDMARNTLALLKSDDLRSWELRSIILSHKDPENHAFQYVDWRFEGEDLVVVSRTAFDDGVGGRDKPMAL